MHPRGAYRSLNAVCRLDVQVLAFGAWRSTRQEATLHYLPRLCMHTCLTCAPGARTAASVQVVAVRNHWNLTAREDAYRSLNAVCGLDVQLLASQLQGCLLAALQRFPHRGRAVKGGKAVRLCPTQVSIRSSMGACCELLNDRGQQLDGGRPCAQVSAASSCIPPILAQAAPALCACSPRKEVQPDLGHSIPPKRRAPPGPG